MEVVKSDEFGVDQLRSFTRVSYVLLEFVGAIPFTTEWTPKIDRKRYAIIWFFLFLNNIVLMIGEHITIWTHITDPIYFKECISLLLYFIYGALGMCKTAWIIVNHDKLSRIVSGIQTLYPTDPEEQKKFDQPVFNQRILVGFKYFGMFQAVIMWSFALFPILDVAVRKITGSEIVQVDFPLGEIYVPFERNNYVLFPIVYVMHIFAINFVQFSIAGADLLLCGLAIQLCNHFDYLSKTLREMKPDEKNSKELYVSISGCAKRHNSIMEYCSELDEVFSGTVLQNFFSSSLVLCLLGFLIATTQTKTELTKYNIHTLISPMVQVFVICWLGDNLAEHSYRTSFAAYSAEWYNAEERFKKSLAIILHKSQFPQYITAYKFSVASLETFSSIISTSWSYLMLLLTLYKQ